MSTWPHLSNLVEKLGELAVLLHIEWQHDFGAELLRQRPHEPLSARIEICDGQIGALLAERLGAAVSDELLVGDTDHQRFFSLEGEHRQTSKSSIERDGIVIDAALQNA